MNLNALTRGTSVEMVGVELQCMSTHRTEGKRNAIAFISIYIPPDSPKIEVSCLDGVPWRYSFVAGDFNAHATTWSRGKPNARGEEVEDLIRRQRITLVNLQGGDTLTAKARFSSPDFALTGISAEELEVSTSILPPIGSSDHSSLHHKIVLRKSTLVVVGQKAKRNWAKLDAEDYQQRLEKTLQAIRDKAETMSPGRLCRATIMSITKAIDSCCP